MQRPSDASSLFLVDTGSGRPSSRGFVQLLRSELERLRAGEEHPASVSDIILTHRHGDHIGGLPDVLVVLAELGQSPPRLHKLRHPFEPPENRDHDAELEATLPEGLFSRTPHGRSLHELVDGQRLIVGKGAENGTTLCIRHTPGHTSDSISLVLEEENAILTGDTVLG